MWTVVLFPPCTIDHSMKCDVIGTLLRLGSGVSLYSASLWVFPGLGTGAPFCLYCVLTGGGILFH